MLRCVRPCVCATLAPPRGGTGAMYDVAPLVSGKPGGRVERRACAVVCGLGCPNRRQVTEQNDTLTSSFPTYRQDRPDRTRAARGRTQGRG
eukprot:1275317-Prymnesium_polylepis.1